MRIRPALPEEAALLGALAMAAKATWGYGAAQVQAWCAELSPSAASIACRPTWVVEDEGTIAGFYQLILDADRPELEHLWIAPGRMRQGIGARLLAHAAGIAAAAGVANLHIDADPHAEAFYLDCGAVRTGTLAAPTVADPARMRPQMTLSTAASA